MVLATSQWHGPLGEISYRSSSGDPAALPLLLLHAVGGSSHLWNEVFPLVSPSCRAIAPDLLGHGDSSDPVRDLTIPDHADVAAGLMASMGVFRFAVAGTSMGALIGLDLAARYPDRVVVLVCNGCPGWHLESQRMARFTTLAAKVGPDGSPRPDAPLGGTVNPPTGAVDARRRADLTRCGRWFISSWWAIAAFDPITRLGQIRCPTQIVMGDADFHLPTSYALADGIGQATMTVLPGVGHLSPFDDPAGVAATISDAIAAVPTATTDYSVEDGRD